MKQLGWLLLAALPFQGMAESRMEDPVAMVCYFCTPDEMYARARSLGVGEHYIYDGESQTNIQGFRVTSEGGQLVATHFVPPAWLRTQYTAMMRIYYKSRGEFVDQWGSVSLQAPGSPHVLNEQVQSNTVLWGHHLTDLNPRHLEAREIVRRFVTPARRFEFLSADTEHGRILRFESQQLGQAPLISRLNTDSSLGYMESFFDYETRRWEYLRSADYFTTIQEKAEDFLYPDGGPRVVRYPRSLVPFFKQRADWAGVEVIGMPVPDGGDVQYYCGRAAEKIQCRLL